MFNNAYTSYSHHTGQSRCVPRGVEKTYPGILPLDTILQREIDEIGNIARALLLKPQRIQDHQSQLIPRRYRTIHNERLHTLQIRTSTGSQPLLDLAQIKQLVSPHEPRKFTNQSDVLGDVPAELTELGVLLDEALHVGYAVYRVGRLSERFGLVGLNVVF